MKKLTFLVTIVFLSLISIIKLNALEGYTWDSDIMVRTEPTINSSYVAQLPAYEVLDLVDDTLYNQNDSNCSSGWYKIRYAGSERYICANYVTIGSIGDKNPSYNEETYEARINDSGVRVRTTPSSGGSIITYIAPGTNVVILEDNVYGDSFCPNSSWAKIQYHKNSIGYVCRAYVSKKSELVDTDSEYEQYLRDLGFPESYIPYLVKVHKQHPNWTFKPIFTGFNWDYAITSEDGDLMEDDYMPLEIRDVYAGREHPSEGGWYYAKPAVIAFYLDPRNFLTEKFMFMFQTLSYDYTGNPKGGNLDKECDVAKKYYNVISSMLEGSHLNTDEYKYTYIEAGYTYNVSPIHLVARSLQEGSTNINYLPVSGNASGTGLDFKLYEGYDINGYYNYYNIHAYGSPSPQKNGVLYACGPNCGQGSSYLRPWNTRKQAITGGAYFIADGYIDAGQDTIYFEKFNVKPGAYSPSFTHRYQTNINAPCSEAIHIYDSLSPRGLLDLDYTFEIPIYNEMPDYTSLPQIASTINTLTEIKIDGRTITNFDKDVIEYSVYVAGKDNIATIEATKEDSKSKVSGLGTINLTGEETETKIVVTAENGHTKTYKIKLIKVSSDNTTLEEILSKLSVKVTDNIMNHISPNTNVLALEQTIFKQSVLAKVEIINKNGTLAKSSDLLSTGQTIRITTSGGEVGTYKIAVTGDITGNGTVGLQDLVGIRKHLLGTKILEGEYYRAADTDKDGNVTLSDLVKERKFILGLTTL